MQRYYRKYIEELKKETHATEPLGRYPSTREAGSPKRHYSISERSRGYLKLSQWALGENANDPALKARVQNFFHV